jgi:hypothetical protein
MSRFSPVADIAASNFYVRFVAMRTEIDRHAYKNRAARKKSRSIYSFGNFHT